jgi:hypothetical protein
MGLSNSGKPDGRYGFIVHRPAGRTTRRRGRRSPAPADTSMPRIGSNLPSRQLAKPAAGLAAPNPARLAPIRRTPVAIPRAHRNIPTTDGQPTRESLQTSGVEAACSGFCGSLK